MNKQLGEGTQPGPDKASMGNPNMIQKRAQPGLYEDFWWLNKSQHSLGTCEAGSPLPKEVISLTFGYRSGNIWLLVVTISISKLILVSSHPQCYTFKVHTSILALLTSFPTLNSL